MEIFLELVKVLVPPILGGAVVWFIKARIEEIKNIQEKLREERRKLYMEILSPYIKTFSNPNNVNQAIKEIKSVNYRKISFEFNFVGSDDVIRSLNSLMQYIYNIESSKEEKDDVKLLNLWGKLLLEIRKDLVNKRTKLNEFDMLKSMIKDIDELNVAQTRTRSK
ncbi:hypothetical protein [Kosmotoga olearia]|uniref:Uncharacterized protein n=1 Tax=Kosmotoga olearia (strain ATCC BAA-1733 / DSM 21960 / TBF 19.5.1) TaxID=521045 RepID=C5CH44_KOSOT|nr:hypothetical protein [Kosmotoga olearia]ACR80647.1 hypothetical protein Kole_1966 [Kosmotoga olearia TBF 19.5.1]